MYFISLEYIPKSEIASVYHNSLFNFQRNCQAVFQIDHAILHFHSCVLIFIHMYQNLFSVFFGYSGYEVIFIVVSICTSLMANDFEHLSMFMLPFVYLFQRNINLKTLSSFFLSYLFIIDCTGFLLLCVGCH